MPGFAARRRSVRDPSGPTALTWEPGAADRDARAHSRVPVRGSLGPSAGRPEPRPMCLAEDTARAESRTAVDPSATLCVRHPTATNLRALGTAASSPLLALLR